MIVVVNTSVKIVEKHLKEDKAENIAVINVLLSIEKKN